MTASCARILLAPGGRIAGAGGWRKDEFRAGGLRLGGAVWASGTGASMNLALGGGGWRGKNKYNASETILTKLKCIKNLQKNTNMHHKAPKIKKIKK